ncbi:(2Fe-2S)-binding protein [Arthrobacter ramosus]|uniref:(2Fe-2S)-binding protein n=1 Tax=Arthrobacter ramosus TaxID=1672 RepID=A0ABV5Y583_ARTRM|nr:(2Fe-2S)-binding protein [Arthrobacter ramosus]
MILKVSVNDDDYVLDISPSRSLAEVLREDIGLTGTKLACGEGFCGSCTVLLNGTPAASCLVPAAATGGRKVETVESLAPDDSDLSDLQQALLIEDAVQCGMCFPGILMTLTALLKENPAPTETAIRSALVANTCRCTGYERIVDAVLALANKEQA